MRAPTMSLRVSSPLLEVTFTIIIPRLDEFFRSSLGQVYLSSSVLQW